MMRVVLDTNVLISGTVWSGASYRLLKLIDENKLTLVTSPQILQEYLRVTQSDEILEKPTDEQRNAALAAIHKLLLNASVTEPTIRIKAVKADPDDDKIIEAAVAGQASHIITQDKHLLALKNHGQIQITTPETFLRQTNPQ